MTTGGSGGRQAASGRGGGAGSGAGGDAGFGFAGRSGQGGSAGQATCDVVPEIWTCESTGIFYHDPATDECTHSGGFECVNGATFATLADCLSTCPTALPARTACDAANQCVVTGRGCCGFCPDAGFEELTAVNSRRRMDPTCGDVSCEPCPEVPELDSTAQYYVPGCTFGQCQVEFVGPYATAAQCSADSDCFLRDGTSCCEERDGHGYVALSSMEPIARQCPDEIIDCAGDDFPESRPYVARCIDGYCRVVEDGAAGAAGAGGL